MKEQQDIDVYVKIANNTVKLSLLIFGLMGILYFFIFTSEKSLLSVTVESPQVADNSAGGNMAPAGEVDYFAQEFDVSTLGNSMQDSVIKYGYELIANTYKYIGRDNGNSEMAYAGNNLSCKNCHLDAGTKPGAAPYVGVTGRFPQYRGRENKIGSIEERINGCMQRSMNGKPLPENGAEMRAMVAYMTWLGTGVPGGAKPKGSGFGSVKLPERAVDLAHGEEVFKAQCVVCHQADGKGLQIPESNGYTYPPLTGEDTYNHGAGMHRVITAAQFIKYNMPLGATLEDPILTDEEAYDVAGYINSLERPLKQNTEADFPLRKRKPMSTPYGPWADDFSEEQHKYGPYQEIMAFYEKEYNMKKTK